MLIPCCAEVNNSRSSPLRALLSMVILRTSKTDASCIRIPKGNRKVLCMQKCSMMPGADGGGGGGGGGRSPTNIIMHDHEWSVPPDYTNILLAITNRYPALYS